MSKTNISHSGHFVLSNRGVTNINNVCSPFRSTWALTLCMLAHLQDLLSHLNEIKPSLMLLVAPVLFPATTSQNVSYEKGP